MSQEDCPTTGADDSTVLSERRMKLSRLRATQRSAYPNHWPYEKKIGDVLHEYTPYDSKELAAHQTPLRLAGRIVLKRMMGKASFMNVQDYSGCVQLYIQSAHIGEAAYEECKNFDLGDIIGVYGSFFRTKVGELTIRATVIVLLSKSLRPLPDKFHGLTDPELRYRQRYVDLIVNAKTRDTFIKKSQIGYALRQYMHTHDFMEVETPMLHPIPGGANARPFVTHHHALKMDMYLRIAPELYLKRLLVGGFNRVFEMNRCFRNEGVSTRHNPEFTMLEFYAAYCHHEWMMTFTESLLCSITHTILGTTTLTVPHFQSPISLQSPFVRLSIVEAILQTVPHYQMEQMQDEHFLSAELQKVGYTVSADGPGQKTLEVLQLALFEKVAEPHLIQPTFVTHYPAVCSPLARVSDTHPHIAERFELFIAGQEIANGFSELNDPDLQAQRFGEQVQKKSSGDEEAMYFDQDYVRALEYAMPPATGCGIGVDRLVMLLTGSASIRDVILFPHLKNEKTS